MPKGREKEKGGREGKKTMKVKSLTTQHFTPGSGITGVRREGGRREVGQATGRDEKVGERKEGRIQGREGEESAKTTSDTDKEIR